MLRPFALAALLLAASLSFTACDAVSTGDQALFEDQAYLTPVGSAMGWRIGPAFDARMRVLQPPTPNPAASGDEVTMVLDVDVAVPGGFEMRRLDTRDGTLVFVADVGGYNAPNFYVFSFLGRRVDPLPGTYRLIVQDASDRVITYGDFTVSG